VHEFITDVILQRNASLVFGPDGERMQLVLEFFAKIVGTKFCTKTCEEKIVQVLKLLASNPSMAKLVHEAGAKMSHQDQEKLQKLM
jgi:hypothetical protein